MKKQEKNLLNKVFLVNSTRIKVLSKIAEGAYADVYKAQKVSDSSFVALKKLYIQKNNTKAMNSYQTEIQTLSKLGLHNNIVRLYEKQECLVSGVSNDLEVYMLFELCSGGTLYNLIEEKSLQGQSGLDEASLLNIMSDIVQGIIHMHLQNPPIAHRDIKIENVLKASDGKWKLCDFGSSSSRSIHFITNLNRDAIQDEIEQTTTPIYRAPEQLDLYSSYPITEKVDIWALACVIYTLMFFKSPFNPGERLAQINGNVKIPSSELYSSGLTTLLQRMFEKDPRKRLGIGEVWSVVDSLKSIQKLVGFQTFRLVDPINQPGVTPLSKNNSQNIAETIITESDYISNWETPIYNDIIQQSQHVPIVKQFDQKGSTFNNYQSNIKQGSPVLQSFQPQNTQNLMLTLVTRMTQPVDQAVNEKDFRVVVKRILQKIDTETNFYKGLAQQEYKIVTIVSLKALIITHKLQLYCPSVSQKSLESLYMQISNSWKEVIKSKATYAKDQFRCEYFGKLISSYADILRMRSQIILEYNNFIDGGYTLQNYFKQKQGKSPLQVKFLDKLVRLWTQFTLFQDKLFKQPLFLWSLRVNIICNIVEDQYLLLCLLTHLIFAFKTVYQRFSKTVPQEVKDFIANFESIYENNLKQFLQFLQKVSKVNEMSHLVRKIPIIQQSLANEVKTSNFGKLNKDIQNKSEFSLSDYLNIRNSILGLQLPVQFKLYEQFEINCHDNYEILVGTQIYRSKVGESIQQSNSSVSESQQQAHMFDEMLQNRQKFESNRPSIKGRSSSLRKSDTRSYELSPGNQRRERQVAGANPFKLPTQRAESKDAKQGHQILSDQDLDFLRTNVLEESNDQANLLHFDHLEDIQNQIQDILQMGIQFQDKQQQQTTINTNVENNSADQDFNMQWIDQVAQNITSQQKASANFFDSNINIFQSTPNQQDYQTSDYLIALAQDDKSNTIQLKSQNSQQQQPNTFVTNLLGNNSDIQFNKSAPNGQGASGMNPVVRKISSQPSVSVQEQNLLEEQAKIERKFEALRKQQEDEIQRQLMIIQKMKQDSVQNDKIKLKEDELNRSKVQFKQEQLAILGQKSQLEVELKKFEEEKKVFEQQRNEEQRKIKEQQTLLEEEKLKLEKMKIQMAEQHKIMEENQKKILQQQQQQIDEQALKAMSLEESKRSQSTPVTYDDKNMANQFLIEEFAKGQDFFLLKLEDLKIEQQIGMGASAEVYKGSYKELDVAIKKLRITSVTADNTLKEFKREVSTLTRVRHPNLVLFVGASADKGHVVIVTEYCHGGTLFTLLHEKKKYELSWKQRYQMALDIAKGMHFLHSQEPHILHRDLKSLNLLLSQPVEGKQDFVQVKITDFGLSRHDQSATEMMTGQAGTFHWMAPETLENKPYTHKADVYSYGIVLWEIICREPPFKTYAPHDIIYKVINFKERPDMKMVPADCPRELIAVMTKCWDQNPQNRPDFADIVRALKTVVINN